MRQYTLRQILKLYVAHFEHNKHLHAVRVAGTLIAVRAYLACKRMTRRWGCKPGDISRRSRASVKEALSLTYMTMARNKYREAQNRMETFLEGSRQIDSLLTKQREFWLRARRI